MGYHLSARGGRFIMRIIGAATVPQPLSSQLQESEAEADWGGERHIQPVIITLVWLSFGGGDAMVET